MAMNRIVNVALLAIVLLVVSCVWPLKLFFPNVPPACAADISADPAGAYTTSVPIDLPSYRGLEPRLSLDFNSNAGNGMLGVGWTIVGMSTITRFSPGKGAPNYDLNDVYYLDGKELIPCKAGMQSPSCLYPVSGNDSYTTRIESFQRISHNPNGAAGGEWYVWSKTGTKYVYHARSNDATLGPWAWDITSVEDTTGNKVLYNRWQDNPGNAIGEIYPDSILYGQSQIKFYYETRPDEMTYANGYN